MTSITRLDLRAQVTELYGRRLVAARLTDPVFFDESARLLLTMPEVPAWVQPGRYVHAAGAAHFYATGYLGPAGPEPVRPQSVPPHDAYSAEFVVDVDTIEPVAPKEWGEPEWEGAEEMLCPHLIETEARVTVPWRFYDDDAGYCGERVYSCMADVALPQGLDGVRAVLYWHKGYSDSPFDWEPPEIAMGDLLRVQCAFTWQPRTLGRALPAHTPVLEPWYMGPGALTVVHEGAA